MPTENGDRMAMSTRIKMVGLSTFLLISCLGCGRGTGISYPSNPGAKWNYQLLSRRMPSAGGVMVTVTNLPQKAIQGMLVTPQEVVLTEHQNGRELTRKSWSFFLAENEKGLVAFKSNSSNAAQYYLIKRPIAVGESWATTTPFSWPPMSATSIVDSVNESVTVPAGVFNGCLKIKVLASPAKSDFGSRFGVEGYMWFASGVGLVKATYQTSERGKQEDDVIVQLESHQN